MLKYILVALALFTSPALAANVPISSFTLGTASGSNINDSFPYVDSVHSSTKRMTLYDIPNLPPLSTALAAKLIKTNNLSDVSNTATAFNNLSPLTTLGDTLYEGSSGAARVAGNTSSSTKYYKQTGTGSASASPGWGFISNADLSGITNTQLSGTAAITNSNLANMAALSFKGNNTTSAATPQDLTIAQTQSALFLYPNVQRLTAASGTYGVSRYFYVTSANATAGATYTNNAQTFTVVNTISGGTLLLAVSTGAPQSSGTLTKSGGTGDSTITFSAQIPPLYLEVEDCGGGGGGGGGGNIGSMGAGGSGGTTTFGSFISCTGGVGGTPSPVIAGGICTLGAGAIGIGDLTTGANGTGWMANNAIGFFLAGGMGGTSPFGGQGSGQPNAIGIAGQSNSCSGGGGGATNGSAVQQYNSSGGGAGGFAHAFILNPPATVAYTNGTSGTAGTAGTNGFGGGVGGTGVTYVFERWQ